MTTSIRFVNVIMAALLAGVSFGIWIGFNPTTLSYTTYVEQQQNMLGALRILMVLMVFVTTGITIISALLQRQNKAVLTCLLVASGFLIACILITRFGNKPIDDIVMTWKHNALPDNWTALRDKWWSLHISRTITELIALVLITWASIRKN